LLPYPWRVKKKTHKNKAQTETESKPFESLHLDHTLSPETESQISRAELPNLNTLSSTKLPPTQTSF